MTSKPGARGARETHLARRVDELEFVLLPVLLDVLYVRALDRRRVGVVELCLEEANGD